MKTYLMRHKTSNKLYAIRANSPEEALQKVSTLLRASGIDASLADVSQFSAPSDLAGIMGGDGKPMTLEQIRASGNELEDLGDGSGGVVTADTKPKPTTPATSGFEWTLGSDGEWKQTPMAGYGDTTGNTYIDEGSYTGRQASFQRALAARGRPTGGFAGEYYQDQFDPYEAAYQGELATNIGGIGSQHDPNANQQLFSKYAGQTDNPYGAILNQFRTLQGMGAGAGNEFANRLTNPNEASLGDAQGFFQQALRGRLGGYAASLIPQSALGRASYGYAGAPVETNGVANPQQNYLDFMRKRLGLGGVNF